MPIWCKIFCQTLGGVTRNWFDDLDPKSMDSFEELSQKFLEEFSQLKRYAKDPTEIHDIKRRQNESLQNFMDRFKSESSEIKGVPPVLRISAFMHDHGHPKLAKKLNDKIPKTVDEMTREGKKQKWTKGGARKYGSIYTLSQKGYFHSTHKTLKEILAIEGVCFPEPPPLIGILEKQNLNKFCDYHKDRGHNTNDCYQLKKQIEEAVASGKLAHLKPKRPYEEEREGLTEELTFPVIPRNSLTDESIVLEGMIEGHQIRRIHVDSGSSSEIMRNISPLTVDRPMGNPCGSCMQLEKMLGSWEETQWRQHMEQMSRIREQAQLRTRNNPGQRSGKELMPSKESILLEKGEEEESMIGKIAICKMLSVYSTLQRMMEKVLANQKGRNVEVYLEEIVVKSKSEQSLVQDVEETLRKLGRMNIQINSNESTFRVEEGKFLGYIITKEGIRADPEKIQAIIRESLPEDQEKVKQDAKTNHSEGGRGTTTQPMSRKRNDKLHAICQKEHNPSTSFLYGLMEEMLKLSRNEGRLEKWAAELRTYDISFIREKEVKGPVMKRFCREGEQSADGARETIKEGSGVGMILINPYTKTCSYAIRLNFNAPNHIMNYEALLAGLVASAGKGMKDLHVFIDSQIWVDQVEGNRIPATKQEKRYKEEIMDATTPFHKFRITHLPKILNPKAEMLTGLATIQVEFLNQEVSVGIKTRPTVKMESDEKEKRATSKMSMGKQNYK
ncbi:reverse transcriptase domain-containing protein [Tanacetum coccineum]